MGIMDRDKQKKVQKTSEGSAEPVHFHSLTRAFPSHILSVKVDECTDHRTSEDIYTFLKVGLCLLIQIPRMFIFGEGYKWKNLPV